MKFFTLRMLFLSLLLCVGSGAWAEDYYKKVTATSDITEGSYLIVYEGQKLALTGSATTAGDIKKGTDISITDGKIAVTEKTTAIEITIAKDATAGYSLKTASGYYIYNTSSTSNGFSANKNLTTANAYKVTLAIESNGSATITSAGSYLRYNTSASTFNYYKASSYTGQQAIALYKKVSETDSQITVDAPTCSPAAGIVTAGTTVTLTQNDADMIMYTTDGTDPSYENNVGKVYSEAITITESTTIKAIAVDADENVSEIATFAFIVADPNAVTAINTIDFSTFGLTNGELFSTCTSGDVTVNFTDGSTATAYYTTGTGIRTYGGGSITVSAGGKDITSIVMTFASGNVPSASDLDGWNISGTTATWNGSATEVTISRPTGSGHWRLQTVKVEYTTANYTREVTVGDFGTVCLPFGVDAEGIKGATFYTVSSKTMDGDDVKSISLEPVTSLTAGVGYIFEATASTVTLKSNGTSASAPVDGVMKGSFTSYVQIPNDMYIVRGTKILKTSDDYGYVGAYRAYIDLSSVATGEAKGRVIYAEGNDATGIQSIEGKAAQDVYYNLNGQRVVQPVKGIYIVNGKKVLVK